MTRRLSHKTTIGHVPMGGNAPIVVQSMTNTDTADIPSTVKQIIQLADAGSELVRITVNNANSAAAIAEIRTRLDKKGYNTPLIGDFHYNGHTLLNNHPDCAEALAKYRINPGNVGFGKKKEDQFSEMILCAIRHNKPVRIGVNWGSLDQALLADMLDKNAQSSTPQSLEDIQKKALIASAINSAQQAESLGLAAENIILSCKVSRVTTLIDVYKTLAAQCDYALHLGLTEAGMGIKGITSSTAALSTLLQLGIGDTIRVSITPEPNAPRDKEVIVAQEILQALDLRHFTPQVIACPGCGRTTSTTFQELAQSIEQFLRRSMPQWRTRYQGVENMNVAVMGCIVNGPGESKHANIGISLPGTGETPAAPVFIDGKKSTTLRGKNISQEFQSIVTNYIENNYRKTS